MSHCCQIEIRNVQQNLWSCDNLSSKRKKTNVNFFHLGFQDELGWKYLRGALKKNVTKSGKRP